MIRFIMWASATVFFFVILVVLTACGKPEESHARWIEQTKTWVHQIEHVEDDRAHCMRVVTHSGGDIRLGHWICHPKGAQRASKQVLT